MYYVLIKDEYDNNYSIIECPTTDDVQKAIEVNYPINTDYKVVQEMEFSAAVVVKIKSPADEPAPKKPAAAAKTKSEEDKSSEATESEPGDDQGPGDQGDKPVRRRDKTPV